MRSFPSGVPTWRIVPGIGGSFRWTQVNFDSPLRKQVEALDFHREVLAVRFPSVKDFLHEDVESKSGMGMSVSIHETFLKKGEAVPVSLTGKEMQVESMAEGVRDSGGVPMVRAGLRSSVGVKKTNSSIREVASILYRDEVSDEHEDVDAASRFQMGVESRSGLGDFEFDGVMNGGSRIDCGNPTFRTASGKPVSVKVSSIRKAASILEEDESAMKDGDNAGLTRQQELLSTTFRSRESSFNKAGPSVLRGEDMARRGLGFPCDGETNNGGFTMFQSGSGKSISIKQSSIYKGASILQENITERGLESPCHRNTSDGFLRFQTGPGSSSHEEPSFNKSAAICEEGISDRGLSITYHGDAGVGFPMFHTGSGKPVSIKQSSIKKAVSVLGGTIIGDMYVSQDHPVEDLHKDLQYNMLASGSSSSSVEFHNTSDRSLLISHDALQRARGLLGESGAEEITSLISLNKNIHQNKSFPSGRSITRLPCERKQQSFIFGGDSQGLESTRATSQGRPSVMPLKEVSNTTNVNMSRENFFSCAKKRSGMKHYPSPFKKPRRFTAPLSNNTCFPQE